MFPLDVEGRLFGDVPMHLELRLSVEDSPNSAGIVIDAIRIAKLARERGVGGALIGPSAYFMKHPPRQLPDYLARQMVERFIAGEPEPELALELSLNGDGAAEEAEVGYEVPAARGGSRTAIAR